MFHVQRWFSGGTPSPEIVIAFREGEPVGDCSYLVSEGQALFIAPMRHADGTLSADLVTLQADPDTRRDVNTCVRRPTCSAPACRRYPVLTWGPRGRSIRRS